jgi:hypothetical protein
MDMSIRVYTTLAITPPGAGVDAELIAPFRSAELLCESIAAR